MVLLPDTPRNISISFTPDFTASLVRRKLFVFLAGSAKPLSCTMRGAR